MTSFVQSADDAMPDSENTISQEEAVLTLLSMGVEIQARQGIMLKNQLEIMDRLGMVEDSDDAEKKLEGALEREVERVTGQVFDEETELRSLLAHLDIAWAE
jgi:hypothetical protein